MTPLEALIHELQTQSTTLASIRGTFEAPVLHGAPAASELSAAIRRMNLEPPPSYRQFLELHNGWERFWEGFSLVGVSGPHTEQARADIEVTVAADVDAAQRSMPEEAARSFVDRERRDEDFAHLPNHLIFATDFNGQLGFFDHRTRRPDGEMEVRLWSPAGITERHQSLLAFLQAALADTTEQIQMTKGR